MHTSNGTSTDTSISSKKALSADVLLDTSPLEVEIPELDGVIYLRRLSAREAFKFFRMQEAAKVASDAASDTASGASSGEEPAYLVSQADLIVRTAINEDGSLLFDGITGEELLSTLHFSVFIRLSNALNAMVSSFAGRDLASPFGAKAASSGDGSTDLPANSESGTSTAG